MLNIPLETHVFGSNQTNVVGSAARVAHLHGRTPVGKNVVSSLPRGAPVALSIKIEGLQAHPLAHVTTRHVDRWRKLPPQESPSSHVNVDTDNLRTTPSSSLIRRKTRGLNPHPTCTRPHPTVKHICQLDAWKVGARIPNSTGWRPPIHRAMLRTRFHSTWMTGTCVRICHF